MKHRLTLGLGLLLSCERQPQHSPPPRPTPINLPSPEAGREQVPPQREAARDASITEINWAEAYSSDQLPNSRAQSLQLIAQTADGDDAEHAAFVLGRRLSPDRLQAVLSVLPTRLMATFARGACGRAPDLQPAVLPPAVGVALSQPHPDIAFATWAFRSRRSVPNLRPEQARTLAASSRFDDQLAFARTLPALSGDPPFDLIEYMQPIPMATAFRSVVLRGSTVPAWWQRWIESLALRTRSNLRAWGGTWLALTESAPKSDPLVRSALLGALPTLREVSTGDAGVDAAFRCANAGLADVLTGSIAAIPSCADDANHWRSLVARVRFAKDRPTDSQRVTVLQDVLRDAAGDVRVLEAIPQAAIDLPPGLARPLLQQVALSRDPGVLAALLEALALHVQQARALPSSLRDQLIRAPFDLDEAASLEARQQALALARALNLPLPGRETTVRALQQARQLDASITPAPSPIATNTARGRLTITTHMGLVVIELTEDAAPQAAGVVIEAAQGGRYNGTTFHRVVPGFVAQGGDPRGDGYGGTSRIVPTELSGMTFDRGSVGIALAGLDTGGMQFFIVTADAPHLDARYPWIGRVVEGMEIVDELMEGDVIERAEFIPH